MTAKRGSRTGSNHLRAGVDPETIFDCQVKSIHEYKRQLLNGLRIVVLFNRLRLNPDLMPPRTFFFAGKAAPASSSRQDHHQVPQQSGWQPSAGDPAVRGPPSGGLPARVLRVPRRATRSPRRRFQSDLDGGLRGERDEQYEVHDERRIDDRHARRRHDRDGRGGRRGKPLPVRAHGRAGGRQPRLVQPAMALRATSRRRARRWT